MADFQASRSQAVKILASRLIFGIPGLLLVLFLPAGTFAWWEAWVYLAVLLVPMALILAYFIKEAPEFILRRMQLKEKRSEQKLIVKLSLVPFLLAFILPGLDHRFGWSDVPVFAVILADLCVAAGYLMVVLVFKENHYASRIIEVVPGQQVIQSGPYRIVRHPMYLGSAVMYLASPLALGSYWAVIPALFYIPVYVARIVHEEKVLVKELAGYPEYQQKTRYRLLPGVW